MSKEAPIDYPARLRAALAAMQKQQATIARLESAQSEPIAIIGMGCRFPGGADDPESFWRLLREGVDAIREVPSDRWPIDEYFDANPDTPGKMATRWGGFLEHVDRFDARFFRISPREAIAMDPQQRLLLEVSWAALEHATIDPTRLAGTQTGVFVGLTTLDYAKVIYRDDFTRLDAYCATGNVANVASGRLSYFYGLRGPSLTVDTACSSSLVAVHLACQSLRSGESDLALAAGVNLMLAPDGSIAISRSHMLSPDGRCKTFDRSANGYARSEGCGVVVLKRWSAALADGDRIFALIRGSAVRQDGARSGLTVPNGPAQESVIRAGLDAAHVKPSDVGYVEAHGTGTSLGDPIEAEAIGNVFRQDRPRSRPLVIGALKTNLGHMESAAGVGGVIKTVLALHHGEIPRHLHFHTVHPDISLDEIPAVVPTRHLVWPAGYETRIAGVSSFGSSGTVAHVVLEAPPRASSDEARAADDGRPWLLAISAATPKALIEIRRRYEVFLETSRDSFRDICYTAAVGRAHLAHRLAVVASSRDEALAHLRAHASDADAIPNAPRDVAAELGLISTSLMGLGADEVKPLLERAARLYEAGCDLPWPALVDGRGGVRVSVPTYAFERERYWPDRPASVASHRKVARERSAPLAAIVTDKPAGDRPLQLGIMFFNGAEALRQSDNYRLLLEAARFADEQGLSSVWIPERHFTKFGSLYPNPATLHAALARETSRVRLMAGSVVMPLHHPLRLTEEWSVVDNLSGGRVGMSFASGWNPDDFALNPERYADRHEALFRGIDQVRRLWRGETIEMTGGTGDAVHLRTYPTPVQRELPLWVTAASNPRTFERAGATGANLLTHLLDHDVDELAEKILAYRGARAAHGHDPDAGQVTVMLHTFLGRDIDLVHATVREPYCRYLKENIHLLKGLAVSRGSQLDLSRLSAADLDEFVGFLYDRFFSTRALLGTVDSCAPLVERLRVAGVDEIACLLDFGPATDDVLGSLPYLRDLADRAARFESTGTASRSVRLPRAVEPRALLDHTYEVRWSEVPPVQPSNHRQHRRTVVVADKSGVGAALVDQLTAAGRAAILVDAETTPRYERLPDADDFVFLRHLDQDATADCAKGLSDAVQFVQAAARLQPSSKLWFATSGSQQVLSTEHAAATQAALWAMLRVLPIERPQLWGGLIDLEPRIPAAASARSLAAVLMADAGEDQLAIRAGRLYAARLARVEVRPSHTWSLSADATYLITGGFGGLGLEAARWLARHGARHLVLAGRSAVTESSGLDVRRDDVLRDLEANGVNVRTAVLDVTDHASLKRLVDDERRAGRPAIRGVVHAAGVWNDRPLVDLTAEELAAVLAPKVAGTLALAECFPSLDLFVGFSAFSALLPAETQGNYAAANAFLDAFLNSHRGARPGWTSVNWGPWADIGFAATPYGRRAHERLESLGITRIAPRDGFAALDALVYGERSGLGVMPVDWRRLFERDPNARLSPLLRDLHQEFGAAVDGGAGRIRDLVTGLGGAAQIACLEAELKTIAAAILRLSAREIDRLTSFTDLGVDSLMAVELKNRIRHEAGVDLPLVKLLEGPSIADLAVLVSAHIKLAELGDGAPVGSDMREIEI